MTTPDPALPGATPEAIARRDAVLRWFGWDFWMYSRDTPTRQFIRSKGATQARWMVIREMRKTENGIQLSQPQVARAVGLASHTPIVDLERRDRQARAAEGAMDAGTIETPG